MKPSQTPLSDPGNLSFNRVVLIVGGAAIFLGGVVFGRMLPQDPAAPDPEVAAQAGDARSKVQGARHRNDDDWLTAPWGFLRADGSAAERKPPSGGRVADQADHDDAADGERDLPRGQESVVLGALLQNNPVFRERVARGIQQKRERARARSQSSRPRQYRPPRVEDPAEEMRFHDDAAFEAWWNAPDKEEPISEEDRAFNEWWESDQY